MNVNSKHQMAWVGRMSSLAIVGLALVASPSAHAQEFNVPLHFGMQSGVVDEYGQLLPGTAENPGALVQILAIGTGIMPPDVNGAPHPDNPVIGESRIGIGVDPAAGAIGKSSGSVSINRATPVGMFARVFNKPTLGESSFYVDSQGFTNSTVSYSLFRIAATQTSMAIDPGDDDNDGLNNSWEKSVGSNRSNPDSDGDGMRDGPEFRAGTKIMDPTSSLALVRLIPQGNGDLTVTWDAVVGKQYQLQFTPLDLVENVHTFSNVNSSILASSSNLMTVVTNGMSFPIGTFRVLLVE